MADDKHSDSSTEFFLKEYEALRKEIEWLGKDQRDLERNVTIAIGLMWVWLLKDGTSVARVAWWMPVLLAILGFIRTIYLSKPIHLELPRDGRLFSKPRGIRCFLVRFCFRLLFI
jgi:hypothetical protein